MYVLYNTCMYCTYIRICTDMYLYIHVLGNPHAYIHAYVCSYPCGKGFFSDYIFLARGCMLFPPIAKWGAWPKVVMLIIPFPRNPPFRFRRKSVFVPIPWIDQLICFPTSQKGEEGRVKTQAGQAGQAGHVEREKKEFVI